MERYRTNFEKDDPSGDVGDVAFLGVDQYSAPENIQPGNVQEAVNVDFTTGNAQTRGGFVCLPELGAQPTGSKWFSSQTSASLGLTGKWECITFGKNSFVAGGYYDVPAVGSCPCTMYSEDGNVWQQTNISASPNVIWSIGYGNGRFVACGQAATYGYPDIYYSTDGKSWTASTVSGPGSAFSNKARGVAYGNGRWVVVLGDVNFISGVSLDNGASWTFGSSLAATLEYATDLTFVNGQFVALTATGQIASSVDGVSWTLKSTISSGGEIVWALAYGNNVFCALTPGGAIYISSDLASWTLTSPSGRYQSQFTDIDFYNGRFVIVGQQNNSPYNVIYLTSFQGSGWIKYSTSFSSPSFYEKRIASGNNLSVVVSRLLTPFPAIYSYSTPTQNIYASGVYSDPDDVGNQWIMLVETSNVSFYSFGQSSRTVSLGGNIVTQQSTIVQCNNLVYLFRGPGQQPLYWDGDFAHSFQLAPTVIPAPGFETIPSSNQATYYQNRLWVINGKDTVSASDVLDFNTYDQLANDFNINTGNSDYLVATFPFGQTTLLAFKHRSVIALLNVDGALSDVVATEVTRQVGLIGINAITSVGPDLAYVSDKNVNLITLTSTNNAVQHKTLPLSAKINRLMKRVNWEYAWKISAAYYDNKLYVSLPIDNSSYCNCVAVYNFITESWYGEWTFDSSINMCIQGWAVVNYLGLTRLHAVTEDGRIFVTDEGQNDISGTTVAEIALSLTTRPYNANNLNHFQRRLYVDIATNRPNYSVYSYTEGVSEESTLLTNQTYSRSNSWKFSDSAYDLTNANNDYNRAYRQDYSTGPNSVQSGTGFLPEANQQIRLPLITQRNGRLSWLQITNTTGFLELLSAGFEVRPGMRGNTVQV